MFETPGTDSRYDDSSFVDLYQRHYRECVSYATRFMRDTHSAEDVVQEAMLKLHRHLDRLDPDGNVRAWLFTVVRHQAFSVLRERGREQAFIDECKRLYDPATVAFDAADWSAHVRGQRLTVLRVVRRLPIHRSRRVLLLRLRGHDYDTISTMLDISRGYAHTLYYRAVKAYEQKAVGLNQDKASSEPGCVRDWVNWSLMWHQAEGFRRSHPRVA